MWPEIFYAALVGLVILAIIVGACFIRDINRPADG